MKLLRRFDDHDTQRLRGGAVTIGNFDGVHHGHAKIIQRVRELSNACGGPSIVFTFDPHPVRLLRPEQVPPPLTWTNRKAALLSNLGVDYLIAYPTDLELLKLSPDDFFQRIVVQRLGAKALVEGPNFFFGKDRAGNVDTLRRLCSTHAITAEIVQPIEQGGELVSSSRIRGALADGDVDSARSMLTEPYRVRGMVTHGAARGSKIGFPTANLDGIDTLIPGRGVFAGRAYVGGEVFQTAINVGPNPTFGEDVSKVEAHVLDFDGNLYGQVVEVDFLTRLRDIQPFDSVDDLIAQLHKDIEAARSAS